MSAWTSDELDRIGRAEELELTTVRSDGTPRKPVTIWVVRNNGDLFIRSWQGQAATWFRSAQVRPQAHIQSGGIERDVELVGADQSLNEQIDAGYRAKYMPVAASYVDPMVSPQARATTLKLEPRS